jgi:hypothetical protein
MKMTMRYAHLSPTFLTAEISLLDPKVDPPTDPPSSPAGGRRRQRARKGQPSTVGPRAASEVPDFVKEIGSSGWIRTSNPPVNRFGGAILH